jgi:hypothetical protein
MTLDQVLEFWSFLFLGVIVYFFGEQVKVFFPALVKKPWFSRTVVLHAPIAATLIAAIPVFPMPSEIGNELGARLLYGLVAGICSAYSYKMLMRLTGNDTKGKEAKTRKKMEKLNIPPPPESPEEVAIPVEIDVHEEK